MVVGINAAEVDLRLVNLVSQTGGSVAVHGTGGDDRFDFAAPAWFEISVNGGDTGGGDT